MSLMSLFHLHSQYALPVGTLCIVALGWALSRTHKLHYPPGPPEESMVSGNLSDLPAKFAWDTYIGWGAKYGDILHFRVYDKHTVVLNSYEDNVELLDKRSAIYSDRPYMPMVDLMGWLSFDTAFMQYGPIWRGHRRIFQQFFKPDVALNYRPMQTKKIHDFLGGLLTTPEDFADHYRTLAGAVILSIMYAHDVAPKDDYLVHLADTSATQLTENIFPNSTLLFAFPSIFRHLPAWFPGAGFKRLALEARKVAFEMRDIPLAAVQKQMKEGLAPNCVTATVLETCQSKEEFDVLAGAAATGYAAGAETTASYLAMFFQAMLLYPDVQRKAKQEIDAVIGSERLITFNDQSSLPYIEALCREVMRWRQVLPLSVAHASTSDNLYKGYYIPKGATVVSNVWAIAHDPKKYPDPHIFNPSRFFDQDGKLNDDHVGYVFGFGRRICPGRHLASATIWLAIATVLQNFDIQNKKDSDGHESPITEEHTDGFVIHPLPFECSIVLRSAEARNIILEAIGGA
ncbi:hypothetical protein HYPSUDRAFT_687551 [Hypholoma sublateritium FD-334 SS-4]|uniref:Cytochrome P450 n=1 Tax=Hypholoma sublateritium (strain FD-334 SS-4) TaxID=945553 RepID=A0A0D2NZ03_HYPSF|nr:hypothetical protein HYPSUDRAFT_687551 [Hypholoma sublateritium FD-334 SS-4]